MDKEDPQKVQKEFLEAVKKMMAQAPASAEPETEKVRQEEDAQRKRRRDRLRFELKPKDVKKYLDRFVVKQQEAKRVLATAICDHYQHVKTCEEGAACKDYSKQNILMLGPTGVGKTYLIRCLSELIGVPFVKADATKFSETGYVGGDVDDLVRELAQKADGDIGLAEYGMIYLDEVDKIAAAANYQGRDVSGTGVQRGLLKIMEETEIALRNPQDIQSQIQAMMEFQQKGKISRPTINTRHILFMVSGAFERLGPIIQRRQKASAIGFASAKIQSLLGLDLLRQAKTEDFIEFGFEPEFIGRLPIRVVCDPLNAEDLFSILTTSEGSVLRQYEASFSAYGIHVRFEEEAIWKIAKCAAAEGTGARGLVTVLEKILRDLKYELPSSNLKSFVVTKEIVESPKEGLEALLREERAAYAQLVREGIRQFEENFARKYGVRIEFEESARQVLESRMHEEAAEVQTFLEKTLSNYSYGLGLIQKKKPRGKFILTEEVLANPNAVLEQWIRDSYEGK